MEVLLTTKVEKLGEAGDLVKVADGYARNFLIPRGLAVEPTKYNLERYGKLKEQRAQKLLEREEQARILQAKLKEMVLTFPRKAHEDKLYSSVRKEELAEKLSEQLGEELEKGKIELEAPLEKLGIYTVKVNLYKDITAEVQVVIEEEKEGKKEIKKEERKPRTRKGKGKE